MKLEDLKPGMEIEDINVHRDVPKYGVILEIDPNKKSTFDNASTPVIIGYETPDCYIPYHTSIDYLDISWRLTGNEREIKKEKLGGKKARKPTETKGKTKKSK